MTIFTTGYNPNLLSYADISNKKMAETNQIVQILAVFEDQFQTHEHLVSGEYHFLSAASYR